MYLPMLLFNMLQSVVNHGVLRSTDIVDPKRRLEFDGEFDNTFMSGPTLIWGSTPGFVVVAVGVIM